MTERFQVLSGDAPLPLEARMYRVGKIRAYANALVELVDTFDPFGSPNLDDLPKEYVEYLVERIRGSFAGLPWRMQEAIHVHCLVIEDHKTIRDYDEWRAVRNAAWDIGDLIDRSLPGLES